MAEPKIAILRAAGTNCELETAYAFERAGGKAFTLHINQLLDSKAAIESAQMLVIPGGFSYGDDIAAGRVFGLELRTRLGDAIRSLLQRGGLVLGICNGFQVLMQSGFLPGPTQSLKPVRATLANNDSHRYEDRWITLEIDADRCLMAPRGIERIELPVAHAEGRFTVENPEDAATLVADHRAVFRYVRRHGATPAYPENPNGSDGHIAGICDESGQVLGLMPHPERAIMAWHHPNWTRDEQRTEGDGSLIFRAAVQALRGA